MATYNVGSVEVAVLTQASQAIAELKKLIAEAKKVSTALNGTANSINKVGNSSKKASSSLKKFFTLGKLYVFLNYTKRMAQSLARTIQNAIDYIETLNKFRVSFGDMANKATKFQNKMSEAFGLAQIDLMNYQANFNNIIKGLGNIDVEVAYNMSETLTKMAVDFASLFNVSIDSAMTKFQSALTQQVRPIRSVSGFDITTPTLQSVLNSLGVTDRTVSQLSQVEKRLLIIIALQRQMKTVGAMTDFARTIEQPANQLKILSQQLKETGIAIGNFALRFIAPAIKYVLGFVMAIKALIKTLYALLPVAEYEQQADPLSDFEVSADDATDAVGKTTKAVKDLKKATTGIDELNIIQQPDDTSSGGGGTGGVSGAIDPRILEGLQEYESGMENVRMKATAIRDRIMQWLGYTKEVNDETGEVTWKLQEGSRMGKVIAWISQINFEPLLTSLGKLWNAFKRVANVIGGIFSDLFEAILLPLAQWYIEDFAPQSVDMFTNAFKFLADVLEVVRAVLAVLWKVLQPIINWIKETAIKIVKAFSKMFEKLSDTINSKSGKIKNIIEKLKPVFETFFELLSVKLGWLTDNFITGFEAVGDVISTVVGVIIDVIDGFITVVDGIVHGDWEKVCQGFGDIFYGIGEGIINVFQAIINAIIGGINSIIKVINKLFDLNWKEIPKLDWEGALAGLDKKPNKTRAKAKSVLDKNAYATGGFPTRGDYFLANENGVPEYVGSIGNRTAVANTNQIVQGISYGVAMAQSEQNALLRQQNALLQQMLAKEGGAVYLDGRKVSSEIDRVSNARGAKLVKGGFAYGY